MSSELAAAASVPNELYLGRVPPEQWHRVAQLEAPPALATDQEGVASVWARAHGEKVPWYQQLCLPR